jgi:enoyl-[acyl-carrier-protein] reductase (NADH)
MRDAPQPTPMVDLSGKRGLIVGIANEHSIAVSCAEVFARCGAQKQKDQLRGKLRRKKHRTNVIYFKYDHKNAR